MTLSDYRFYCCGSELNFSMFSDVVCRARYLDSIEMTLLSEVRVDVYTIEPAATSRWLVVRHTEDEGIAFKCFVRQGDNFVEVEEQLLPSQIRAEITRLFPHLLPSPALAA